MSHDTREEKKNADSNDASLQLSADYKYFFSELKAKIRQARIKAAVSLNQEVLKLYWQIGDKIIEKQTVSKWGDKFIELLSRDLRNTFPESKGFSISSLKRMRMFAQAYPDIQFGSQAVTQLPWGHIQLLLFKVKNADIREWYATQCLENGWSRISLEKQINNDLYKTQGINSNKATNFLDRLPAPQSQIAQDLIKSPYNFEFLGLHDEAHEREIENASIKHITGFMLELGKGFAFIGSQVPIEISGENFFIDMLFYNLNLRCYTVIELKATKFKPEHAGQLNFYLSAVDDLMRHTGDNPSIGLLLCKSRDKVIAEYALRGIEKPIGVSEYQLTRAIPADLQSNLPTVEEIEAELNELESTS